ncbi:MAG: ribbon-helix-helix protein, CopG family [Gaiellaceae bacterium]
MAERAISVRLDEEAQRALDHLMRTGKSQSAAIRDALIDAAKLRLYEQAAEEAKLIANDPDEQRELAEIRALFNQLDAEG